MRGLIDAGYVYIAQPPLYKIKRKKREQYVDNDEQLNRISSNWARKTTPSCACAITTPSPRPRSTASSKPSPASKPSGAGVTRYGCSMEAYLDAHNAQQVLPKYLVRLTHRQRRELPLPPR